MNKITLILIALFYSFSGISQEKYVDLTYISPKPNSKLIMPGNNIVLRHGEKFDIGSVKQSLLNISTSKGAEIQGELKLSDDGKSLIFKPHQSYSLGDIIQVQLGNGLKTNSGSKIKPIQFQFEVAQKKVQIPNEYLITNQLSDNLFNVQNISYPATKKIEKKENNLPDGFPGIQINVLNENASDGYYFFTPYDEWGWYPDTKPFLTITDKFGTPVYYRKLQNIGSDLKIQPTGDLSFYSFHPFWEHSVMDHSYRIIDSYKMGNGYGYTDFHEFQLLENGHAFVMTYDSQYYPMDTVVEGGHPNAIVTGFVFQELDSDKEVVFQWRSWDHFLVTDAGPFVNLTDSVIDYVHGNSIEIESENSLLISSRNMDEVTRINRNTGDIIWRLGGKKNQFEFINDPLGFSVQHDARRLDNGNVTIFDNGSLHPDPKYSSGLEYELDEDDKTATLISRIRSTPDILGVVMGNLQWRSESSKVIGWGSGVPGISEFDANGDVLFEMEFEGVSYRAYFFPWESNYFTLNKDTLQYGYIWQENSLTQTMKAYNNSNQDILLTSYYSMDNAFSIENEFPVTIPKNQHVQLKVKFTPDGVGEFEGMLTINSDINSDTLVQRIAQQIYLVGNATSGQSINQNIRNDVLIYPNPASDELIIKTPEGEFRGIIQLHNILGEVVVNRKVESDQKVELDISFLPNGVYFVYLIWEHSEVVENYKIIKH